MKHGYFVAAGASLLVACGSSTSEPARGPDGKLPEPVGAVSSELVPNLPQCNHSLSGATAYTYMKAKQVTVNPPTCSNKYWKPFPNPTQGESSDQITYEQDFFSIPRANGYEYLITSVLANGQWQPANFFLVGIRDSSAVPSWLSSPPQCQAPPQSIRLPSGTNPFSPTQNDWSLEEQYDLMYESAPTVQSNSYPCVVVEDQTGQMIDFFALAGYHDPNGQPW